MSDIRNRIIGIII